MTDECKYVQYENGVKEYKLDQGTLIITTIPYSKSDKTWPNIADFTRAVEKLGLNFSWGNYSHGR